jgi:adenosylhomocysteinase
MVDHKVKDLDLAGSGRTKIEWAGEHMPVLARIKDRFEKEKPFRGICLGACLHVTTETANLALALQAGGADVRLCASNPLSTKDDVAASLVRDFGVSVFAIHAEGRESYYENIRKTLEGDPRVTLDDGGDLTTYAHEQDLHENIIGGTEETTTGVIRFRAMESEGVLRYPIVAVNDSKTKYLFDNRYGTGQSTIDGILRATNRLIAGSVFVVCGYGWCGRGVAMRAKGMGARVYVTEVDPVKALEAVMDGFEVMPIAEVAPMGDIFVTVTGDKSVIAGDTFDRIKDGAVICNTGHFDVEIDKEELSERTIRIERVRPDTERYVLKDGRRIYLLAEGRLVNLSAAEGHPPTVMDMSFADQALASEFLLQRGGELENRVYTLPDEIDERIARIKLETLNIRIDTLTEEQEKYLTGWREGT